MLGSASWKLNLNGILNVNVSAPQKERTFHYCRQEHSTLPYANTLYTFFFMQPLITFIITIHLP